MERKIFKSKNGAVEYSDSGKGSVILSLHGAMGGVDQSEILSKTVAPEGYRVISVSRPGYLGTPLSVGKSPAEQADLYRELLDYLDIETCIVLAVSGGGYGAIFFAAENPERCSFLILCSVPGVENDSPIPFSFTIFTFLARFQLLMNFMKNKSEESFSETLKRAVVNDEIREQFSKDNDALELYKGVALGMFDNIKNRIAGTRNDIIQTKKLTYPLAKIKAPTLIIHGTDDTVVPFEKHAKYLESHLINSQLFIAEKGEHSSIFTHREEIRECVKEFLDR